MMKHFTEVHTLCFLNQRQVSNMVQPLKVGCGQTHHHDPKLRSWTELRWCQETQNLGGCWHIAGVSLVLWALVVQRYLVHLRFQAFYIWLEKRLSFCKGSKFCHFFSFRKNGRTWRNKMQPRQCRQDVWSKLWQSLLMIGGTCCRCMPIQQLVACFYQHLKSSLSQWLTWLNHGTLQFELLFHEIFQHHFTTISCSYFIIFVCLVYCRGYWGLPYR